MSRRPWGQHFLKDQSVIHKVVRALEIQEDEHVLEIGPGKGALTFPLIRAGAKVVAVEVDSKMIEHLLSRNIGSENLEIIHQDFLNLNWQELIEQAGNKFKVASNLPYQSSTAILLRLFHQIDFPTRMVLMFQKEVAERILAQPGTRVYGRLTVITQIFASVRKICDVSLKAFSPPPEVESTILQFDLYPKPLIERAQLVDFEEFLAQAFQFKRKLLRNNLKASKFGLDKAELNSKIHECLSSPMVRAEEVPLDKWLDLFSSFNRELKDHYDVS